MSTSHRDPAARLLIEDAHQGVTTPAAQATIDRYRHFVQEKDAPIAHMNYSPFTRAHREQANQPTAANAQPAPPQLPSKSRLVDEVVPASRAASSRPASPLQHTSPTLEPSLLHTRAGGAAWDLHLSDWQSKAGLESKRGSRIASLNASRKSSLIFAEPKQHQLGARAGGHETSQAIWSATMDDRAASGAHTHRSFEKEQQMAADERLAEPQKRLSLSQSKGFLRAHSTEARYGVTLNSRPLGGSGVSLGGVTSTSGRMKRASMPPLQNRRSLLSQRGSLSTNRRSSLATHAPPAQPLRAAALRNRSQSLPCDSLFLAYSSCALPAVMTSSLANMPIPSQPAIPVSVARRYSVLSHDAGAAGGSGSGSASVSAEPSPARSLVEARAAEEPVQYVDPEQVEGIDTSSTLDTSHLQDMAPLDEEDDDDDDDDRVAGSRGQSDDEDGDASARERAADLALASALNRASFGKRASLTVAAGVVSGGGGGGSSYATPMGSPVAEGEVAAFPMPPASTTASPTTEGQLAELASSSPTVPPTQAAAAARSRSLIQTTSRNGLTILAPARDQLDLAAHQDYTPMTSPTNLSHAAFKSALLARRMSDVVARDLARKLQVLKKHMQRERDEEETEARAGGGGRSQPIKVQ